MWLTSEQALAHYHRAYDNTAYQTVCRTLTHMLFMVRDTPLPRVPDLPEYIELTNLLTDAALEICGHPDYRGVSWTLAQRLRQISSSGRLDSALVNRLFEAVEEYLAPYRQHMQHWQTAMTPQPRTESQLEIARHLAEESMRSASEVAGWQGRTAYHLSAAGAGLLRVATICLQASETSSLHYAAEKLGRAVQDIYDGLGELTTRSNSPAAFTRWRHRLTAFFQEGD